MEELGNIFGGDDLDELEYTFSCGVCLEPFEDPRTLSCSHSLCSDCLTGIYRRIPSCPFCRSPFGLPFPITNQRLLTMTQRYLQELENRKIPKTQNMDISVEQNSPLLWLPKEVLFEIYSYLRYHELGRCAVVCKSLKEMSEHSWLWRDFCNSTFPFCDMDSGKTWKKIFEDHTRRRIGWEQGRPKDFKMTPWRGHTNYINCFDLYRRNVVSGGADFDLKIWNFGHKDAISTLKSHTGVINCVKFNEIWVVSGSADSTARIWDTTTGATTHTLQHQGAVNSLFFDNSTAWTASSDRHVRSWDCRSGNPALNFNVHLNPVTKVEQGPNNTIITHDVGSVRILDTRNNGQALYHLPLVGISTSYYTGENRLAVGTTNGTVAVYDVNTGTQLHTNQLHHQAINGLHGYGDCIVTASQDNTCKIWNMKTQSLVHTLSDHSAPVNTVQMDEHRVVSGGADMCMKVWNRATGQRLYSLLGGSRQERGNNPPHPIHAGCSGLKYDQSRVIGSYNSLLRVYSFAVDH